MDNGIGSWITVHSIRTPHRLALTDGDTGRTLTYREVEQRTNALADALRSKGVRRGDRVAFVLLNSPHMLEVVFAVAKLGAIAVPINFRLSAPEIHYILTDSAACIVFASEQVAGTVREASADSYVREIIEIPSARSRAADGGGAEAVAASGGEFEALVAADDSARFEFDVAHGDIASLMYTSGTTGFPKGTMLTHGNHLWNAINSVGVDLGLTPQDVSLTAAPMFHIGAFGIFTLPLVYLGGNSVILEAFTPGGWLDAVARYRPTVAFCVPAMWAAIDNVGLAERDLTSLRYSISGGAPCPVTLIESLREHGMVFTEGFGLTETAPVASVLPASDVITRAGSIGKPVTHVQMRVADEDGHEVRAGQVGELLLRGPSIFVGYWQKPEATRSALRDGWFFSGDLARMDDDGYFFIVDRKKDMVITGGENVYPAEVEQVLYRHNAIAEVAVIGSPDEKWGESVTAVVVLKDGANVSETALIDWIRGRLAHFKCPRSAVFIDALPRTATGKILKRELRRELSVATG